MKNWLDEKEHTTDEDIIKGAFMLLKLTRNQIMFQTIMRKPQKHVDKIVYELRKRLPMRLAHMTTYDVKVMDSEITPVIKSAMKEESDKIASEPENNDKMSLPAVSGKRSDHDSLPDDIKNIWPENAERWKKIKKVYNTLLTLKEPCDRFENLTILSELWYTYKREFERYDNYKADSGEDVNTAETDPAKLAKIITNARSYISKNIDDLLALKAASAMDNADDKTIESYKSLLAKMTDRVLVLLNNKQVIGDDLRTKLVNAGIESMKDENVEDKSSSEVIPVTEDNSPESAEDNIQDKENSDGEKKEDSGSSDTTQE